MRKSDRASVTARPLFRKASDCAGGRAEMKKRFRLYWLLALLGTLAASYYPLCMCARVLADAVRFGEVRAEDYPKYIIPYAPISIAVITGVLLMPLILRREGKLRRAAGYTLPLAVFFASELLLENIVVATTGLKTTVENWQMFMCISPNVYETRQLRAIDVLIGEYSPLFKLHFYAISVVLILALLGSMYGFGRVVRTGDRSGVRRLTALSLCALLFLGMCIWACFTAFYRTGELLVSPLSACLMGAFFILLGTTAGLYAGSFLRRGSGLLSAFIAAGMTLLMYVGEMILLSGQLYRFGTGYLFEGIAGLVLAPVDILIILAAGGLTFLLEKRVQMR